MKKRLSVLLLFLILLCIPCIQLCASASEAADDPSGLWQRFEENGSRTDNRLMHGRNSLTLTRPTSTAEPTAEPASVPTEEPASVPAEEPDSYNAFLGSWHLLDDNGESLAHLHILKDGAAVAEYTYISTLFAERLTWSANGPAAIYVHTLDSLSGDVLMIQIIDENTLYIADFGICERIEKDPLCAQFAGRWEYSDDGQNSYIVFRPDMTATMGYTCLNMADVNQEMIYSISGSEISLWPIGQSDNVTQLTYNAQTDSLRAESFSYTRTPDGADVQPQTEASPCVGVWKASYQLEDSSPITSTLYLMEDHNAVIVHESPEESSRNILLWSWSLNGSVLQVGEETSFTLKDGRLLALGVLDAAKQPIYFDRTEPALSEYAGVYHTLYCSGQNASGQLNYCYLKLYLDDTGLGVADAIDPEDDGHDPDLILWDTDNSMVRLYSPYSNDPEIMLMPVDGQLYDMTGLSEDGAAVVFDPVPANDEMIGKWRITEPDGVSQFLTLNADGTASLEWEPIPLRWKAEGGLITLWSAEMGFEQYAFFIGGQILIVDGGEIIYGTRVE